MSKPRAERVPRRALEAAEAVLKLLEEAGVRVREAYLFGSYARGDWLEDSDVDLVIVSDDFEGMPYLERLELIYRLEWERSVEPWVEVIPLTPVELAERLEGSAVLRDARRYWIRLR